jgi:pentatricopeptide repeat protein
MLISIFYSQGGQKENFMSLEVQVVTTLLGSLAASGLFEKAIQVFRERLREKGVEKLPETTVPVDAPKQLEVLFEGVENRRGPAAVRDLTLDAILAAHEAATELRAERMRQARVTFNAAISLAVLGVLIIFGGIALLLLRDAITAGALTASVGAVVEVVSAILFRLNHETNNRLDELGRDLSAIEAARIAMTLIEQISDLAKRDDAIRELVKDLRASREALPLSPKKDKGVKAA